jgi:hypothetical protein
MKALDKNAARYVTSDFRSDLSASADYVSISPSLSLFFLFNFALTGLSENYGENNWSTER